MEEEGGGRWGGFWREWGVCESLRRLMCESLLSSLLLLWSSPLAVAAAAASVSDGAVVMVANEWTSWGFLLFGCFD